VQETNCWYSLLNWHHEALFSAQDSGDDRVQTTWIVVRFKDRSWPDAIISHFGAFTNRSERRSQVLAETYRFVPTGPAIDGKSREQHRQEVVIISEAIVPNTLTQLELVLRYYENDTVNRKVSRLVC
jgi:hypothetical protein